MDAEDEAERQLLFRPWSRAGRRAVVKPRCRRRSARDARRRNDGCSIPWPFRLQQVTEMDERSTTDSEGSLRADARPAVAPHSTLVQALCAHPIGSAIGAVAGLLLGALAGIAAGPIGSLFGALCGMVLGMLLGTGVRSAAGASAKAIGEHRPPQA
jgi:phage tail tape-measure protein